MELPPQSFGEQAFLDATGPEVKTKPTGDEVFPETDPDVEPKNTVVEEAEELESLPSAKIRMSGRSRLAFAMPSREAALPFTLEAFLDACRRWPMRLDVTAAPEPRPQFVLEDPALDLGLFNSNWLKETVVSGQWAASARGLMAASATRAASSRTAGLRFRGGRRSAARRPARPRARLAGRRPAARN